MSTSTDRTPAPLPAVPGTPMQSADDFLSLRDMLRMILRHRWFIALFALLVTAAAGAFFLSQPREYQAKGYLQVIPPTFADGRVDKDLMETRVLSHLQRFSAAFLSKEVSAALLAENIDIAPWLLQQKVKIGRVPKTNLISLEARNAAPETALRIAQHWVAFYLKSDQQNSMRTALSEVRRYLQQSQANLMEQQVTVEQLKAQLESVPPLIIITRGVDDQQLWRQLAEQPAPDSEALQKLAQIHIRGEEQNLAYLPLCEALINAEQALAAARGRRDFFRQANEQLEELLKTGASHTLPPPETADHLLSAEVELYIDSIIKNSEVVPFGEPGLALAGRRALTRTGLVFIAALLLAGGGAFLREWGRGLFET